MLSNARAVSPPRAALVWILGGLLIALAIGGVTALSVQAGLALCAVLLLPALLRRFEAILIVLVVTVFLEVVSFGGVTISRLAAPIAAIGVLGGIAAGRKLALGAPVAWATLYSLWATASLLWTSDTGATLHLLGSLLIALVFGLAFAILIENRRELEHVLAAISLAAICVGGFAIASFLHLGGASTLQQGRAAGTSGDANFFASYELVALPLMFALSTRVRWGTLRNLLYAGCLLVVGAVLTTLSRGGLVTLVAIVAITLVLPSKTLFQSRRQKLVVMTAIVAGAAIIFQALSAQFLPRFQQLFNGTDSGGSGREILWQAAERSIGQRPVTGLGYGAFASASSGLILSTPNVSLAHYELRPGGEVVHSAYIGSAAELGLPGLFLFTGLILSTARTMRRLSAKARRTGDAFMRRLCGALLVSLIGWSVASLFLSSETSRPFWLLIGITLATSKLIRTRLPAP